MRRTKKVIYAEQGIQYRTKDGRIFCEPLNKWIKPVLKVGNNKVGKPVKTFSMTAGNNKIDMEIVNRVLENVRDQYMDTDANVLRMMCGGTCNCNCPGCYAQAGHYVKSNVRASLAWRTFLVRAFLDWSERAIDAQIAALNIKMVRIHAAGDFFSNEYVMMWARIAERHPDTIFWTYTKTAFLAIKYFDSLPNCNVVKSLVNGGFNFGRAGYLIRLYHELVKAGKSVWICRCGIDKNQHCNTCHHCFSSEYVLFLEHGTDYRPGQDSDYPEFIALVNSQIDEAAA